MFFQWCWLGATLWLGCADWSGMDGAVDISPGGFWIDYIRPGLEDGQSIVAAPVTGSLASSTLFSCRDVYYTARFALILTICGTDWVLPAGYKVLLQKISERWTMDADGLSVVDNRAGVMFGVCPVGCSGGGCGCVLGSCGADARCSGCYWTGWSS